LASSRLSLDLACPLSPTVCAGISTSIPLANQDHRNHELDIRQEPQQARIGDVSELMSGFALSSSTEALAAAQSIPIEPVPIVRHRISDNIDYIAAANDVEGVSYVLSASLTKPDDDTELQFLEVGVNICHFFLILML
jgi:hypothetical protein